MPERVLVFARDPDVRRWVEHELFGEPFACEVVETLTDVVTGLTVVPPPWPQYLIVDTAAVSETEVELLAVIRSAGWPGLAIAIGVPPKWMSPLLDIDVVLPRTLVIGSELLRKAIKTLDVDRPTVRMHRLAR